MNFTEKQRRAPIDEVFCATIFFWKFILRVDSGWNLNQWKLFLKRLLSNECILQTLQLLGVKMVIYTT